MQDKSDGELLRNYAQHGVEAAFREIVERHTDLIYSAALRQVTSPDLAGDIAQSVFVDLARKAGLVGSRMAPNASLVGWLYRSTRYAALNHLRDHRRRATLERQAMEQLLTNSEPAPDWERIRPILDEALGELSDEDREALLLRYFKNHDFRTVGLALGVSDDTAQKRVSRAVERLREFFHKRGIAIGSGGLAAVVSTNAVQAAPAGLAATISTAAGLTGTALTATTITKTIAMTTLQKTAISVALVTTIAAGLFEAHQASHLRQKVRVLQQQQTPLAMRIGELTSNLDSGTSAIASLKQENEQLRRNAADMPRLRGEVTRMRQDLKTLAESNGAGNDPFVQKALKWKADEARLRQIFDERPGMHIPEMRSLGEDAWLNLAKDQDYNSEDGIRRALGDVRRSARNDFIIELCDALQKYVDRNDGKLPETAAQLKSYFGHPVDDDMLNQYRMLQAGKANDVRGAQWLMTHAVVDPEYDTVWGIGAGGFGQIAPAPETLALLQDRLDPAIKQFASANGGNDPSEYKQLIPYVNTAAQSNALERLEGARGNKIPTR